MNQIISQFLIKSWVCMYELAIARENCFKFNQIIKTNDKNSK